jgi:hypothetical protein
VVVGILAFRAGPAPELMDAGSRRKCSGARGVESDSADGLEYAGRAGSSSADARVAHFRDPEHMVTEAIQRSGEAAIWIPSAALRVDRRVRRFDELYRRWRDAGAKILPEPEDKPRRLREFRAADPDGKQLRVFHDFSSGGQDDSLKANKRVRREGHQR